MIDYILYAKVDLKDIPSRTPVFSDNGHFVTLCRVDDDYTVPDYAEVLASGHCESDCPFMKLTGEALEKYNLAYPRPFETTPAHEEDGIFLPESYYQRPFKFGVIE